MLSIACLWALGRLPGPARQLAAAASPSVSSPDTARRGHAHAKADPLRWPSEAALVVLAGCLLLVGLIASWAAPVAQLHTEPNRLAERLVLAATFGDASAAQQALQALRHLPQVRQAWLLDSQDHLLAHHVAAAPPPARLDGPSGRPAAGIDGPTCRAIAASPGWALRHDHVLLAQAVRFKDVPVGCLCLDIGLARGYRQAAWAGAVALLAGACWRRRQARRSGTAA